MPPPRGTPPRRGPALGALVTCVTLAVAFSGPVGASGSPDSTTTTTTVPGTTTSTTPGTTTTSTTVRPSRPVTRPRTPPRSSTCDRNPFASPAVRAFLASRVGSITAGIYCPATGATYLYRPGVLQITASMVKIDILATLLHEDQVDHGSLSPAVREAATTMIEQSDNATAQMLWNDIGGFGLSTNWRGTGGYYAISAFNALVGMRQSVTSWGWGTMLTTPADYLRLLRAIWLPGRLLDPAAAQVERQLMENVIPAQRFGVPAGVPADAIVGVKDGWLPDASDGWQVNSAGYVHQGSTTYLAVLMSAGDPTETYGIATLSGLGDLLWRLESRAPRP